MVKRIVIAIIFVSVLALPITGVFAAFQKSEGFYIVSDDEVIDDNVYVFADSVDIRGTVSGDLVIFAGTVSVNGLVEGDIIVAGGDVSIDGLVEGDIRVFAGNIQIDGSVGGNILGAGGEIMIGDESSIGHSLTVATGILKMNGSIAKNLIVAGGMVTINGSVGNNVQTYLDRDGGVILGGDARIGGDVQYVASKELQRLPGAEVAGIIQKIDPVRQTKDVDKAVMGYIFYKLFLLVWLTVVGLVFLYFFPRVSRTFSKLAKQQTGITLLYGFALFFLVPIIVFILLITVIGIPLALILLALYGIALYLTKVVVAITVGTVIVQKIKKQTDVHLVGSFFVGAVILAVITGIPVVGHIVGIVLTWWGLGILFSTVHKKYTELK